ncbi:hypothetical protein D3C80_275590 [compost metagenome]
MVADSHALEAPVLAQQVVHQPGVGRGGYAVDRVQRDHHATGASIDGGAVGRQIVVEHLGRAHVDSVVVAPAFNGAVQGEVLDAGHQAGRLCRAFALEGLDHDLGDARDQVGVFTKAFAGAAPTRISGNIDHGREGHVDTVGGRFQRRDSADLGDCVHVPARGQGQADREDRAVAVDHVIGEEHRNLQATAPGCVLHRTVLGAGDRVERTADAPRCDFFANHFARHFRADADQAQLADFLVQGHLAHQVGNKYLFVLQRICRGVGKGRLTGQADEEAQQTQLVHEVLFSRLRAVFTVILPSRNGGSGYCCSLLGHLLADWAITIQRR